MLKKLSNQTKPNGEKVDFVWLEFGVILKLNQTKSHLYFIFNSNDFFYLKIKSNQIVP